MARLARILANALFSVIGRRALEWLGKICLKQIMRNTQARDDASRYTPVPPCEQVTDLILFVDVVKQIQD
jgi:hypothetical protein